MKKMNLKRVKIVLLKKRRGVVKELVALFREGMPYFEGDEEDLREELRDYFAGGRRDTHYFAAMLDGKIIGLIGYLRYSRDVYNMGWFCIRRNLQGQGIGTMLLTRIEQELMGKARLLMIECLCSPETTRLLKFYSTRGYRPVSVFPDFYNDENGDMILFSKRLAKE